jgi:hypothetical protein
MGRTAYTEPLCLYTGDLYLYLLYLSCQNDDASIILWLKYFICNKQRRFLKVCFFCFSCNISFGSSLFFLTKYRRRIYLVTLSSAQISIASHVRVTREQKIAKSAQVRSRGLFYKLLLYFPGRPEVRHGSFSGWSLF